TKSPEPTRQGAGIDAVHHASARYGGRWSYRSRQDAGFSARVQPPPRRTKDLQAISSPGDISPRERSAHPLHAARKKRPQDCQPPGASKLVALRAERGEGGTIDTRTPFV